MHNWFIVDNTTGAIQFRGDVYSILQDAVRTKDNSPEMLDRWGVQATWKITGMPYKQFATVREFLEAYKHNLPRNKSDYMG